jgi:hypothetical protein
VGPDWSAVVQAISAAMTAAATVVLVRVTIAYAQSAHRQVDELVLGRLAATQPMIVVRKIDLADLRDQRTLHELALRAHLQNVGNGPALSVRAVFEHSWLDVHAANTSIPVLPVDATRDSDAWTLLAGKATSVRPHSSAEPLPEQLVLKLEYRSISGQWYELTIPARLTHKFGFPEAEFESELELVDQEIQVRPVTAPSIHFEWEGADDEGQQ